MDWTPSSESSSYLWINGFHWSIALSRWSLKREIDEISRMAPTATVERQCQSMLLTGRSLVADVATECNPSCEIPWQMTVERPCLKNLKVNDASLEFNHATREQIDQS